jgi:hypothetical protein
MLYLHGEADITYYNRRLPMALIEPICFNSNRHSYILISRL